MTAVTTTRPSPRPLWTSRSQSRSSSARSSTTPIGLPTRTPGSVGQPMPLPPGAKGRSPKAIDPRCPSPNYFGLVVEASNNIGDSNTNGHVRANWPPSSSIRSTVAASPSGLPLEANPDLEAFRRQSERGSFNLGHGNLSSFSTTSSTGRLPTLKSLAESRGGLEGSQDRRNSVREHAKAALIRDDPMDIDVPGNSQSGLITGVASPPSFLDIPRQESPLNVPNLRSQISRVDDMHPRQSLPQHRVDPPSPPDPSAHAHRGQTLPTSLSKAGPVMITSQSLAQLMKGPSSPAILLLDVRVSPQFLQSRIKGAINICIPTTLLKRPSFDLQKLAETLSNKEELNIFSTWKEASHIVVYDANPVNLRDATACVNMLKKFSNEGWRGASCIVSGGFLEFRKNFPDLINHGPGGEIENPSRPTLSIDSHKAGVMPVAGGCPMPATQTAANPFFGNIRQNMDLVGGVGLMPIQRPMSLADRMGEQPAWIARAADERNGGQIVADGFFRIEKAEQDRMYKALTAGVSYGSPTVASPTSVQISGIEKGEKNRYKDMLPFDHSRVRLQNIPRGGCDYINASHIKARWSNRRYIASQAPVPATFEDFWRLVWEQDVRLMVMLTAESEGGQRKSHPYWLPNNYGPLKIKALSETRISLEPSSKLSPRPSERPGLGRRRATNPQGSAKQDAAQEAALSPVSEVPHAIIRKLTLSHASYPFQPLREITQIHYSSWPDFGAPAHPAHVLALVEHCNSIARNYTGINSMDTNQPVPEGERPILVHCSAGCGRTGTFCTVDSVVDILKRQRMEAQDELKNRQNQGMSLDDGLRPERDAADLVAKTVEDFRLQRISMVQTLRQYVLCYEAVLEWLAKDMAEKPKREGIRRSFHG